MAEMQLVDAELIQEAHHRRGRIIELGHEVHDCKLEQAEHLNWFKGDERRWECLGYDSWEEFLFQEDMLQALNVTSQGAMSKTEFLIWVDLLVPEANVLGPGRSKIAEAGVEIRPKVQAALAAPPGERGRIVAEIAEDVDKYRSMTAREVQAQVQTPRPSPYRLTVNGARLAIAVLDEGSGELNILLVQAEDCDPVGAGRVMSRLLKQFTFLLWDEDGIWGKDRDLMKPLLRWTRPDIPYNVREAVAKACGAERRI